MRCYSICTRINHVANDDEECSRGTCSDSESAILIVPNNLSRKQCELGLRCAPVQPHELPESPEPRTLKKTHRDQSSPLTSRYLDTERFTARNVVRILSQQNIDRVFCGSRTVKRWVFTRVEPDNPTVGQSSFERRTGGSLVPRTYGSLRLSYHEGLVDRYIIERRCSCLKSLHSPVCMTSRKCYGKRSRRSAKTAARWPSLKRRLIPPLPIKLHNENSRIIDGVPCCGAKGHSTEGVIRPRACLGFIFTQIVVAGSRGAKSMPSIA